MMKEGRRTASCYTLSLFHQWFTSVLLLFWVHSPVLQWLVAWKRKTEMETWELERKPKNGGVMQHMEAITGAKLPSVCTAAVHWHPPATVQDGNNPWKRTHGIAAGLWIPWRSELVQDGVGRRDRDGVRRKCRCLLVCTKNRCSIAVEDSQRFSCFCQCVEVECCSFLL